MAIDEFSSATAALRAQADRLAEVIPWVAGAVQPRTDDPLNLVYERQLRGFIAAADRHPGPIPEDSGRLLGALGRMYLASGDADGLHWVHIGRYADPGLRPGGLRRAMMRGPQDEAAAAVKRDLYIRYSQHLPDAALRRWGYGVQLARGIEMVEESVGSPRGLGPIVPSTVRDPELYDIGLGMIARSLVTVAERGYQRHVPAGHELPSPERAMRTGMALVSAASAFSDVHANYHRGVSASLLSLAEGTRPYAVPRQITPKVITAVLGEHGSDAVKLKLGRLDHVLWSSDPRMVQAGLDALPEFAARSTPAEQLALYRDLVMFHSEPEVVLAGVRALQSLGVRAALTGKGALARQVRVALDEGREQIASDGFDGAAAAAAGAGRPPAGAWRDAVRATLAAGPAGAVRDFVAQHPVRGSRQVETPVGNTLAF